MDFQTRSVHSLFLAVLISVVVFVLGCTGESQYRYSTGLGDVLGMEDARRITDWTLAQTDIDHIGKGISSLHHIVEAWKQPVQRQEAADGLSRIHERALKGWAKIAPDIAYGNDVAKTQAAIVEQCRIFIGMLEKRIPDDPIVISLWKSAIERDPAIREYGLGPSDGIFRPKADVRN